MKPFRKDDCISVLVSKIKKNSCRNNNLELPLQYMNLYSNQCVVINKVNLFKCFFGTEYTIS